MQCPGKSWNLLGNDVGSVMRKQTPKSVHLHTSFLCLKSFFCYFFATCDFDKHILQRGCCCHTIHMVSNCCLSLYLNIAGLRQGPGKMLLGSWNVLEKSLIFFCNQESGNRGSW